MPRQLDEAKRESILDSALEVFGQKGFAATTVKDIADKAGIAAGTVYTYFKDKVDLFSSVSQRNWDTFHLEMEQFLTGPGTPEQKARRLLDQGMDRIRELHPLMRGMYSESLRQNLLTENVNRLTQLLARSLMVGIPAQGPWKFFEQDQLIAGLHILIVGILFDSAMTPPDQLDAKINEMRFRLGKLIEKAS